MLIESLRLGSLDIPDNKIITMKRPILGFEHLSLFCLVEREDMDPFLWMQSMEDPAIAFIVVNPIVICPDYHIEVNPKEIAELEITELSAVETYVIVTIPDDPTEISANLQGPVLINTVNGYCKQLILVNSDYEISYRILDSLPTADKEVEREEELVPA